MEVKDKKRLILPLVLLSILVVVGLVVLIVISGEESPAPTEISTDPPVETTTEPTLPPPEANPYGPLDFQYDGRYLSCLAGESILGIDVSAHQQQIDWEAVAAAGIRFVMLRVGYRGYETGALVYDEYVQSNYQGAKAAGLQVGAYFFSQAISVEEALEEAEFFRAGMEGWELDLPVVYDWEYIGPNARTAVMDARKVTDCTVAFCESMRAEGYEPMIYFNRHQAVEFMHLAELKEYPFWLALYSDRMTYPYKLQMWQYTSTGRVPGIEGDVDINLWFDYE